MAEIGKVNRTPTSLCEFEWRIPDFDTLSSGSYFSPYFSFDGSSWNLFLVPNGEKESHINGFAKLCLLKTSGISPDNLEVYLGLKTIDGKIVLDGLAKRKVIDGYETIEIYGTYLYISRIELFERESELLSSNILTVVCTLKYSKFIEDKSDDCTFKSSISLNDTKLLHDLKELYLNKEDCDVVIRIKGQEFPAHKAILKARSSVFASIFRRSKKVIVELEDCDPSFFSDFLCFLYCGDAGNISEENVFSLFVTADKYNVQDLRTKCIEFMEENLSIETFCETLTLAVKYSDIELIKLTNNFFTKNASKIIMTVKWQLFVIDNLYLFK